MVFIRFLTGYSFVETAHKRRCPPKRAAARQNLVARELAEKIVDKLSHGVEFKVYIILPAAYDVMNFDKTLKTLRSMYRTIGAAIHRFQTKTVPTDYLNLFVLKDADANVQSSLVIFDDEHVVVGSTGITDRALDGAADTELAVAAFQPKFTEENNLLRYILPYGERK